MAVAAFKGPINGDYCGDNKMERRPSGRRRIFVQTETGYVLGIELDCTDNAHIVKRRLQLALDLPTEDSSLVYGDVVLKNDLSAVRNFSPLLLTKNLMHRSSSTPCLSPTGGDFQQKDFCGPVEILGYSDKLLRHLVKEIVKAVDNEIDPVPVHSGLGGAYFFRNRKGENCAIVKPTDEEPYAPNNPKGFVGNTLGQPGLKRSVRVGETGYREVAAYLMDHGHFANVPPTALVKITHSVFNLNNGVNGIKHQQQEEVTKIASLQQFIPHEFDASDHGASSFSVASVHKIGILDVRIMNTDRHAGNLLVRKLDGVGGFGLLELIPIDHGLCLPENLEDPYFEWIHWPQASVPFSEDELEYIANLNPFRDIEMLRTKLPMIREACLRVLVLCTIFLKEAAVFGLSLAEIGEMMSRQFQGGKEEPSDLEVICIESRRLLEERKIVYDEVEAVENDCLFDIDSDKEELDLSTQDCSFGAIYKKCEECTNQEEEDDDDELKGMPLSRNKSSGSSTFRVPSVSKSFKAPRNVSVGEKSWCRMGTMQRCGYLVGMSSGNSNVTEQLPGGISFVKLADIAEEVWPEYLQIFQKLLIPAFVSSKSEHVGHKQRQRLGTSCQF